jgi:hypothetical protein
MSSLLLAPSSIPPAAEKQEPRRNRVVVSARQAAQPGGIGSLESILWLLKTLKIRALEF